MSSPSRSRVRRRCSSPSRPGASSLRRSFRYGGASRDWALPYPFKPPQASGGRIASAGSPYPDRGSGSTSASSQSSPPKPKKPRTHAVTKNARPGDAFFLFACSHRRRYYLLDGHPLLFNLIHLSNGTY
eukprot:GHVT01028060.1.p1 GENE.GHVT01028060.1~~GHVT01028060.1.p1  ORF type:complete len:129 (-),score=18.56 GHVT01028060.1:1133-1519(-)